LPSIVQPGPHYERAPVVEAIIEIRCEVPERDSTEFLRDSVDHSIFTSEEQILQVTGTVQVAEGTSFTGAMEPRITGYRFRRSNPDQAVQARMNGFAFSWLGAYKDWDELTTETEKHWLKYLQVAEPVKATRLGVRFINRIVVPTQLIEFNDYLRIGVNVPPYLPQEIRAYLIRVQIPIPQMATEVTISSGLEGSRPNEGTALILDIDAWKEIQMELSKREEREQIPALLNTLRNAKNYAFESCITDATRRLIE
jgi:uncharacterized protein (TIGR04255 family)